MNKSGQAPSVRVIDCPSCGGSLELRAAGYSTRLVCQYCASELDIVDDEVRLVIEHAEAADRLHIPLGSKGVLKGVEWCVVGYLELSDDWGDEWDEYLLFNPYHGYRWLVCMESGWSFGTPLLSQPSEPDQTTLVHDGKVFKQCYQARANTVEYVIGEFYWQVDRGDEVVTVGYVCGNEMLNGEAKDDEYEWTLEEWIDSRDVAEAFGVDDDGQYPAYGDFPLPHQPNPQLGLLKTSAFVAVVAFGMALLFVMTLELGGQHRTAKLVLEDDRSSRQAVLGPFKITGRSRPFMIETRGDPGSDSWLDVEYELSRLDDGESRVVNQPIEYYSGSDWVEDNRGGTLKLSSLPPGQYELRAQVIAPEDELGTYATWRQSSGALRTVQITAGPGGIFWSNLFVLFLALFAPVAWIYGRYLSFESARRSDYDFQETSFWDSMDDYDDD